ncbi:CubicO group peptidase, beta-lactamase class C family [Palleronia marisminoris]|uniref:D-alanyl-D-alanine carboxypeptidase n=1 Tax=Palleronia marisminoris TaxID=315423 RepID=A0A1Y5TP01_9RHOB|nr:serine hydrolase domain-containing protein [Palleronia marisminoris]SFH45964.1 CubicO group peptidase, beta-lactamase class C family [Palleronia marisminoris]SLN68149.1 D-alanyl-D-alanine carboxypeptidase precursor [Palleronia marisminoris]
MTQSRPIFSCRICGDAPEVASGDSAPIFPYWSFTKTVIAICALKLAEAGKIDLDEPIAGQPFTLRQLLSHTAGLPDYGTLRDYHAAVRNDEEPWSRDDLLSAAMAQGRRFAPGQGWAYSNVGYMLARERVEDVADRSFACLVKDMICEPLGLRSIALATTREDFSRVHWQAAMQYHPGWVYHGCLIGTAADAAWLLHALFTSRLLKAATLAEMLHRYPLGGAIQGRPWIDHGYGLGLMSGRVGVAGRAIGHSGAGPFCVNAVYHFPDLEEPVTVASFSDGQSEGIAEFAAMKLAENG